jgi:hypothetical protein
MWRAPCLQARGLLRAACGLVDERREGGRRERRQLALDACGGGAGCRHSAAHLETLVSRTCVFFRVRKFQTMAACHGAIMADVRTMALRVYG